MKSTLTNEQLIAKAKQWVKELCESGGRKWSLRVPVDFNHDPDVIFIELCNRLEEYAQQSQPSGMRCEPEFIEYINKSRAAFVKHIHGMKWDVKLRTAVDDLLICFGQMKNRLSESSPAGAAEGIKCKCPDNIKHGQTSVMCCNHCGLPDEDFWNNRG